MEIAYSIGGVPIRLTEERWTHIVENPDEMKDREDDVLRVVEAPEWITRGQKGSLIAWRGFGRQGFLCVHYKEVTEEDGFVITAYLAKKAKKEHKIWPK